jgi:hypothetical protein
LGKVRNEAYDGGVAPKPAELEDVDGRYPGDCGGLSCDAEALRFDDDALSRGDGEAFLDRDRSNSFSLFVLNKPSNCVVNPLAHCSSNSPPCCEPYPFGSAISSYSRRMWRVSKSTAPLLSQPSSSCICPMLVVFVRSLHSELEDVVEKEWCC